MERFSKEEFIELLSLLVKFNSVNPAHGGPGEALFTDYLRRTLKKLGLKVVSEEIAKNRFNVYAMWDVGSDSWDVFDAHSDTVTIRDWPEALQPKVVDGKLYGRGAVDVKVNWAMWLMILEDMVKNGKKPLHNKLFVATVDEEVGFLGARGFLNWVLREKLNIRRLLIAEPTQLQPIFGHRGGYNSRVTVLGAEAHSAIPEQGINAIEWAASCVTAVRRLREQFQSGEAVDLLGKSTITTTLIEGGSAQNVVPGQCQFSVIGRIGSELSVDGMRESVAGTIQRVIAAEPTANLSVRIKEYAAYPPLLGDANGELLRMLAQQTGLSAGVVNFGSNGFIYGTQLTNNVVIFGPGNISVAHTKSEYVPVDEAMRAIEITARLINDE